MTTSTIKATPPSAAPSETIPPLENGDRLSRDEFERRFDAMPDLKKAELIGGIVYMGSPVRYMGSPVRASKHGGPHAAVITWLGSYWAATPGVLLFDNASVRLGPDDMPQPDTALLIEPARGGQASISADDYIEGGPGLVVEIAASSISHDLHTKLDLYRRHGVREYLIWRVPDHAFDWCILRDGDYELMTTGADGLYRSETFPGLWLDPSAMIRGDLAAVLEALRRGVESPEHATFVARLRG